MIDSRWGVGVRLNAAKPMKLHEASVGGTAVKQGSDGKWHASAGVMLFREAPLTKWLALGPVVMLGYRRPDDSRTEWEVNAGLRPVLTFTRWLSVETRFGLSLLFSHYRYVERSGDWYYRNIDDSWTIEPFGSNVGVTAAVQIMYHF